MNVSHEQLPEEQLARAIEILAAARHLVALTGAGISTPSGIPDFRSPDSGLWQDWNPMEVASLQAFRRRPEDFYAWVRPLVDISLSAEPNAAHHALCTLEKSGKLKTIITQNIDLLHNKAGSRAVLEVHGHMRELVCLRCGTTRPAEPDLTTFSFSGVIPRCSCCSDVVKPKVVLFGEQLPYHVMRRAEAEAKAADVMIIAGSSLEVYPVNELPWLAHRTGARLIIVNLSPTHLDEAADVVLRGDVIDLLPSLVAHLSTISP